MCDIAGQSSEAIQDAYQQLYARRLLVPSADGRSIRMAPPFSGLETQQWVHVRERQYYGNCAWDAFGVDVVREGKTVKGRVLGLVLRTIGGGVLEKAFENSVKAIEGRNGVASEPAASLTR